MYESLLYLSNRNVGRTAAAYATAARGMLARQWVEILFFAGLLISFNPFPTDQETFAVNSSHTSAFRVGGYVAFGLFGLIYAWRFATKLLSQRSVPTNFTVRDPLLRALILTAIASVIWSEDRSLTITQSLQMVVFMSLFAHYTRFANSTAYAIYFLFYATGLLLLLSVAGCYLIPGRSIHNFVAGREVWLSAELIGSWRGIFFHKNYAGGIVMFAGIAAIPIIVSRGRPIVGSAILLLAIFFLYKTKSSTSALAPALALVVAVGLAVICNIRSANLGPNIGATLVAVTIASFQFLVVNVLNPRTGITLDGRSHIWDVNFKAISENWIHGYGYAAMYSENTPLKLFDDKEFASRIGSHAHSGLMEMLGQLGILGGALFVLFFFILIRNSLILFYRSNESIEKVFGFSFLWACVAAALRCCMEPDFFEARGNWYILALLFVAGQRAIETSSRHGAKAQNALIIVTPSQERKRRFVHEPS